MHACNGFGLDRLVWRQGTSAGDTAPTAAFPFEKIANHPVAQSVVARNMLARLRADVAHAAQTRSPAINSLVAPAMSG